MHLVVLPSHKQLPPSLVLHSQASQASQVSQEVCPPMAATACLKHQQQVAGVCLRPCSLRATVNLNLMVPLLVNPSLTDNLWPTVSSHSLMELLHSNPVSQASQVLKHQTPTGCQALKHPTHTVSHQASEAFS